MGARFSFVRTICFCAAVVLALTSASAELKHRTEADDSTEDSREVSTGTISGAGGDVAVDGTVNFSFTPNTTALWTFVTSNNGNSDPYLWLYDADGQLIAQDDDGGEGNNALIIMLLTGGTQYSVLAGFYGNGTGAYRLNVSSSPLIVDTIPSAGGEVNVGGMSHFSFTPDTTAMWTFLTSDNGSSDPYLWLYDENWQLITSNDDGGGNRNALIITRLAGGTQYFVRAGFYGSGTGAYKLSTSSAPIERLPNTGGDVTVNKQTTFAFTPNTAAMWTFRTSDNGDSDPYLWLYDADWQLITRNDDGGGGSNALITIPLAGGVQYFVRAGFFSGRTGTYKLNVSGSQLSTDTLPSAGGNVNVDGETFFTFRPNTNAIWTFVTSNNGSSDPYLWLYDANWQLTASDDDGGEGRNALIIMPLVAGTRYFIRAGFYDSGTGAYKLNVSSLSLSVDTIPSAGGEVRVRGQAFFTFTPDTTARWTFRTSNNGYSDPYLWLYDENWRLIAEDDDGGDDKNALIVRRLTGGTRYFIRAGFYNNEDGKYRLQTTR
ncbi:MAG: DVUA0089 family protein [Chitinispirillales bacterium]|jgi:hypothetical protein|nr:DVUA0089 family protein [Chitinispirillales bacterium]